MNDTNPATTANLLLIHREALAKVLATDFENPILSYGEHTALRGLLNACPERPALEDGIYEVQDDDDGHYTRYVRDGRYSPYRRPDGTLYNSIPLPADVSGWRLLAPASAFTSE